MNFSNPNSPNNDSKFLFGTSPILFTETEAATFLKVSRITLQRIRLRGEIGFSRVGGTRIVYTHEHLQNYLTSRERAAFHTC